MASRLPRNGYILGLDVGDKRIGVALASVIARLPQPLEVILADDTAYERIRKLVEKENVQLIVVGIPRNLDGEETHQSQKIRQFAAELSQNIKTPIEFADESLSSKRAEEAVKHNQLKNFSQDSLAACFILEAFLGSMDTVNGDNL